VGPLENQKKWCFGRVGAAKETKNQKIKKKHIVLFRSFWHPKATQTATISLLGRLFNDKQWKVIRKSAIRFRFRCAAR
jgi:redox-regulated HSP33 family molecular chaperone